MENKNQEAPEGFDLRVHVRGKDGLISKIQPYRLSIKAGRKCFARGGRLYNPDGTEIITAASKRARAEYEQRVAKKKDELFEQEAREQVKRDLEEKAISEVNLEMAEEESALEKQEAKEGEEESPRTENSLSSDL